MGIRQRKIGLIASLRGYVRAGSLTQANADAFEARYRACHTEEEQDAVRRDVQRMIGGFQQKPVTVYDKLRQDDEDEDDDPPALKAALARAGVSFLHKRNL